MLSIPMQGSMPMGMSMQQGVYGGMGPGQPPMYMAGPPYGMHPGAYSHLQSPHSSDHCLSMMPEHELPLKGRIRRLFDPISAILITKSM